jgi:formamidopyrimidine-DNA glycosylase
MPELPEVEVTRLSFVDRIVGAQLKEAKLGKPLRWALGVAPEDLSGRTVVDVRRRGKYLLVVLSEGMLLVHLGMSGSLTFEKTPKAAGAHDHFDLITGFGTLRLHDPRRFGAVVYATSLHDPVAVKLLGKLGVEPLGNDFEVGTFHHDLKQRKAPIKQVLLAGECVVGVGNIYASEALFLAGIRPTTRANKISRPRSARLHAAIRQVLGHAIERGGTTLRDFSNAQGEAGHFQLDAMVYGRAATSCRICATPIRQIRQGQRSTFFCPCCQKP